MTASYVIAIVSIVAIVLLAGVAYLIAMGKGIERTGETTRVEKD